MLNQFKRIFQKSPEYVPSRPAGVKMWTNKEAAVRYVPNLGTGTLAEDTPVMAGLKSPHENFRLCEILNHTKGIKVYGWIAEADLTFTAP